MLVTEGSSPPRIVVVEDNVGMGELLLAAFEKEGWPARHLADAPTAIEHLKHHGADFVILDVQLGDESGFDVLRSLRADAMHAHTPVFMLTASRRGDDMEQAEELGAAGYVVKPLNVERLIRRIERLREDWEQAAA